MTASTAPDDPHDSWREDAACLDHPAEWFTGPHEPGDTRRAIDVCTTCPVKQPCLAAALSIEVSADLGIWGGTTPATRRRIRGEQSGKRATSRVAGPPVPATSSPASTSAATTRLRLVQDSNGDFIDGSGRVIVFEIHGDPPFMLMIDGRPRARTATIDEAAGLADRFLEQGARTRPGQHQPTGAHLGHSLPRGWAARSRTAQ